MPFVHSKWRSITHNWVKNTINAVSVITEIE